MANGARQTFLERIVSSSQSAASKLLVKSALNPMLWLCGIISTFCYGMAYFARGIEPLATVLVYVGSAPIVATIIGFFYFMIFAPEKLQSEEYQIRHETLEFIRQKGSSIEISPSSLEAITNPGNPITPSGKRR